MYSKIMVPVDMRHREQSQKALETAADLAKHFGASMVLLTVDHPLGHHSLQEMPEQHNPAFDAFVAEEQRLLGVDKLEAVFTHADVAHQRICEEAEELGVDLIVMGSHDPRLSDYLFGSNASRVVLHTPCSVMVVR